MKKNDSSKNKDTTALVEQNKAEVSVQKKNTKPQKTVPAKKLPGLFKKIYKKEKFEKLLKRIYVPTDRALVEKLYTDNPEKEGTVKPDLSLMIPKNQFNKLKKIAKDVSSQKFSIKIVPLVATVIFAVGAVMTVAAFKNKVARILLVNTMQGVFGAKTDIDFINVEIMGSSVEIRGLYQGFETDPMKNLFELDKVIIDFDLAQLLRGKFDLENVAVEGINVMTPRKTSAALPKKEKKDNSVVKLIQEKAEVAKTASVDELKKLFEQYNPENILKNLQNQLKSPAVAADVQTLATELVNKWKTKPDEIAGKVTSFSGKVEALVYKDWSKVNDIKEIKTAIEQISSAISESKSLIKETKTVVNDVKTDSLKIKEMSENVANAIKSDVGFVDGEIKKIKSFTVDDGKRFLSGPIDSIMYQVVGKYYPYIKKGVNTAMQIKSQTPAEKKEKVKKEKKSPTHSRLPGINVTYHKDTVPKFLIQNLSISGPGFSGKAHEISSDMDVRGRPADAEAVFTTPGQEHKAEILVDARSETVNPLVKIDYSGNNYPVSFSVPQFALDSSSVISGVCSVDRDGNLLIDADLDLHNLKFKTEKFEPEFAYDLYTRALSSLTDLSLGVQLDFKWNDNFDMKLESDADKKFIQIVKKLANEELEKIKVLAKEKITTLLNEQTGGATQKISEFINIENGINSESIKMDKLNSLLNEKKKELESMVAAEAKNALSNALGDSVNNIKIPKLF